MGDMAAPVVRHLRLLPAPADKPGRGPYGVAMTEPTPTAADIAAAFRHYQDREMRQPPTPGQMHRLLFLAQGHFLAWYSRPLFADALVITDVGVLVTGLRGKELDGEPTFGDLDNSQLTTIGYVLSRYGNLTLHDLDVLSRHSQPAVEAGRGRYPRAAATIRTDAMADYFAHVVDVDPDAPMWNSADVARLVEGAEERLKDPSRPDDMDRLQKRADEIRARMTTQQAAESVAAAGA